MPPRWQTHANDVRTATLQFLSKKVSRPALWESVSIPFNWDWKREHWELGGGAWQPQGPDRAWLHKPACSSQATFCLGRLHARLWIHHKPGYQICAKGLRSRWALRNGLPSYTVSHDTCSFQEKDGTAIRCIAVVVYKKSLELKNKLFLL